MRRAGVAVHRGDRVADHGERAVAEQVDLHQPRVLGAVLLELDDRYGQIRLAVERLRRRLDRHVVGERGGDDDDAAGMDREMARHAHQRRRHAGEVAPAGRQVELAEVGMGGEQLLERLVLEDRDPAGDLADLAGGAAVHLGHLAQRAAQPEAVVVGDHRRLGTGIGAEDVGQHLVPLVPGKIEIDVGRILALGVEEALEEQSGAERLDVGDAETVAHDRVGHRAAAAVGGPVLHDVVHHQEIVGEALPGDDAELVLQPVAGHRRDGAVAAPGALIGQRAEPPEAIVGVGEARRHDRGRSGSGTRSARRSPPPRAPPRGSRGRAGRDRPRGGARHPRGGQAVRADRRTGVVLR